MLTVEYLLIFPNKSTVCSRKFAMVGHNFDDSLSALRKKNRQGQPHTLVCPLYTHHNVMTHSTPFTVKSGLFWMISYIIILAPGLPQLQRYVSVLPTSLLPWTTFSLPSKGFSHVAFSRLSLEVLIRAQPLPCITQPCPWYCLLRLV